MNSGFHGATDRELASSHFGDGGICCDDCGALMAQDSDHELCGDCREKTEEENNQPTPHKTICHHQQTEEAAS